VNQTSSFNSDKTIQSRLTRVVILPSAVLLVLWLAISTYMGVQAFTVWAVGNAVQTASIPAVSSLAAIQQERSQTMRAFAAPGSNTAALDTQRAQTDAAVATLKQKLASLNGESPPNIVALTNQLITQLDQLPSERAKVTQGPVAEQAVFSYYNNVLSAGAALFEAQARVVSDAAAGQGGLVAEEMFRDADRMSQAAALGDSALLSGGFTPADHLQFVDQIGAYHASLDSNIPFSDPGVQAQYQKLITSPDWQNLVSDENSLIQNGGPGGVRGVSEQQWRQTTDAVDQQLLNFTIDQANAASTKAVDDGNTDLVGVLLGSLFALIIVITGIVLAFRNSRRMVDRTLVARLDHLRNDSLQRANELLPDIMSRLEDGEEIDIQTALPPMSYGADEIGQVAEAFNAAQNAAVTAAVREVQARKGFSKVFLGIAHRNQVLVHRQLKVIDTIERKEADPDRLEGIFQLDNLVTRARRNSENLIILAGASPGRRWRRPRRLVDVLRAAVGEIEQYVRVQVTPVPDTAITGTSVGDTVHLLAELLDNATQFSSPRSQVQVYASKTPQGVLVEIEDRGLGMSQDAREAANTLLSNPPSFDTVTVRGDDRLGLFVIATLASRQGIDVKLRQSLDGGTLAVVLLPPQLLAEPDLAEDSGNQSKRDLVAVASTATTETTAMAETTAAPPAPRTPPRRAPEPASQPARNRAEGSTQLRGDLQPESATPESPDVAEQSVPPLPQRRRQQHLAPQLRRADGSEEPAQPPASDEQVDEQVPERVRGNMSAIQRATREARQTGDSGRP
jgi:signal transduction histidine kinase